MIWRHYMLFLLWKCFVRLFCEIKVGQRVKEYSSDKSKWISGTITCLSWESSTRWKCYFDIQIEWDEPVQGYDYRYFIEGSYSFRDFISDKIIFDSESKNLGWKSIYESTPPQRTELEILVFLNNKGRKYLTTTTCEYRSHLWESVQPEKWRYPIL